MWVVLSTLKTIKPKVYCIFFLLYSNLLFLKKCSIMSQLYSIPQKLQCILHKMQIMIRSIKEPFEFRPEKQTTNVLHGVNVISSKMQMDILIDQDYGWCFI